jgi:hypothetical protein
MKLKIGSRSKVTFVTFAVTMLLCLIFVPTVAMAITEDEIYKTQYEMGWVQIPYGNGIDDDQDGTIDEDDGSEPDVVTGTNNVSESQNAIDSWHSLYTQTGVWVGGSYEELWRISSSDNVSISGTANNCYEIDVSDQAYELVPAKTISVLTYYMNIPANKLMNGASEFWFRSPLAWDTDIFFGGVSTNAGSHFLNIYDDDDTLVWASPNDNIPQRKFVRDNSTNGLTSNYYRIYYKIDMNFITNVRYRFEEYIRPLNSGDAINYVDVFMARFQDIAGDGETDMYTFWGTNYTRKLTTEASWSIVFTLGKGLMGGEKIIFGDWQNEHGGSHEQVLETQWINGSLSGVNNTGSLRMVFPLRTTRPLNMSIEFRIKSGNTTSIWDSDPACTFLTDVTGTLIYDFNITDPDPTKPNAYQFIFHFTNLWEDFNGNNASLQAVTFYMYPVSGTVITYMNASGIYEANAFSAHVEIAQESTAKTKSASKGPNIATMLFGFLTMVVGILLIATVVGAVWGIPLAFSGVMIATGVAVATGVGTIALGAYITFKGYQGYTLKQVFQGIADGVVRFANDVINGIRFIAGAIWDGLMWVVTKILELGQAMLYWGGVILDALAQIVYFLAFVLVIYMWNWFLVLMKHISRGDIEQAFAQLKKPIVKYAKKTLRYSRAYTATEAHLRKRAKTPYGSQVQAQEERTQGNKLLRQAVVKQFED